MKSMKWINEWINEIEWRPAEIFLFPLVLWWLVHMVVVETCLPTVSPLAVPKPFWAKFGEWLWTVFLMNVAVCCSGIMQTWGCWEPASFVASLQVRICFPLIFLLALFAFPLPLLLAYQAWNLVFILICIKNLALQKAWIFEVVLFPSFISPLVKVMNSTWWIRGIWQGIKKCKMGRDSTELQNLISQCSWYSSFTFKQYNTFKILVF